MSRYIYLQPMSALHLQAQRLKKERAAQTPDPPATPVAVEHRPFDVAASPEHRPFDVAASPAFKHKSVKRVARMRSIHRIVSTVAHLTTRV